MPASQKIKLGTETGDAALLAQMEDAWMRGAASAGGTSCLWPAPYNEPTYECACRFVFEVAKTQHEQSPTPLPIRDKAYLRWYIWHWVDTRQRGLPLIVWKTRRILISWVSRILELFFLGFQCGKHLIADENYAKAQAHCYRYHAIYEYLRQNPLFGSLPEGRPMGSVPSRKLDAFILPNGSLFVAINSEEGSFQGDGVLSISTEELPLYQHIQAIWAQALTLVKSDPSTGVMNGHVVAIGNTFLRPEWLELKKAGEAWRVEEGEPEVPNTCMIWKSTQGTRCLKIPLTADPDRDQAWVDKNSEGYEDNEWNRLFGMVEAGSGGQAVYQSFDRDKHCPLHYRENSYKSPLAPSMYFVAMDVGTSLTPAAVLGELALCGHSVKEAQGRILCEYVPTDRENRMTGMETTDFISWIRSDIQARLPYEWTEVVFVADSAMNARSSIGYLNVFRHIKDTFGIKVIPVNNLWSFVYDRTSKWLRDQITFSDPNIWICEKECEWLTMALSGAYCYGTKPNDRGLERPEKNGQYGKYSNVANAFEYFCVYADKIINEMVKDETRRQQTAPHGFAELMRSRKVAGW